MRQTGGSAHAVRFRVTLLQQPDNLEHGYEQLECHESADRNDHGNRDLLIDSGHAEAWDSILRLASMSTCPPSRGANTIDARATRMMIDWKTFPPNVIPLHSARHPY